MTEQVREFVAVKFDPTVLFTLIKPQQDLVYNQTNLPEPLKPLVEECHQEIKLQKSVTEYSVRIGRFNRTDRMEIGPTEEECVGRLVVNFGERELYNIYQGVDMKTEKKGRGIRQVPNGTRTLDKGHALFITPGSCSSHRLEVSANPRRQLLLWGRKVSHLRPPKYDRITVVIDFKWNATDDEIAAMIKADQEKDPNKKMDEKKPIGIMKLLTGIGNLENDVLQIDPTLTGLTVEQLQNAIAIPSSEVATAMAYRGGNATEIEKIHTAKVAVLRQLADSIERYCLNQSIDREELFENPYCTNDQFATSCKDGAYQQAIRIISDDPTTPVPLPHSWIQLLARCAHLPNFKVADFATYFITTRGSEKD